MARSLAYASTALTVACQAAALAGTPASGEVPAAVAVALPCLMVATSALLFAAAIQAIVRGHW